MQHVFLRTAAFLYLFFVAHVTGADTVHMVLEQDVEGVATHRAVDLSEIGDGLDPVLEFILLDEPTDPLTAQVLWRASEKPIHWNRNALQQDWRFVEHATLPDDGRVEYRVFLDELGFELTPLRHVRTASDDDFGVDPRVIDQLPLITFELQAHIIVPDRPTQILMQRIDVSDANEEPTADEIIDPEPEPEPEPDDRTLKPGTGWTGPTETPAQIGSVSHEVIAHWNVVPEQTVGDGFTVGVIAHHLEGIDRVEISANGGQWVQITDPSLNPRTNCVEYFAELSGVSDELELRAIAYPTQGRPRVLEPLTLFVGEHVGKIIELDAGHHVIRDYEQALPDRGWLVIKAKPGLSRDQVKLLGPSRWANSGRLKVQGVTWTPGWGGGMVSGAGKGDDNARVWLDDVEVIGHGNADPTTDWMAHLWGRSYFTDCKISKIRNVFHGSSGRLLARNLEISEVYEDVFRAMGLAVNVTIDNVDRGVLDSAHPDLFDFKSGATQQNIIFQDIKVRGAYSQGMAGSNLKGVAMINVDIETFDLAAFQVGGDLQHLLIQDSRFASDSGARFRDVSSADGVVLRRSEFGNTAPWLPDGWHSDGIVVQPRDE